MPPVEDHPVHAKVRIGKDFRYGCHNVVRESAGYYAPNRHYFRDGRFEVRNTLITNTMSRDCKYDMYLSDPYCEGCLHRDCGDKVEGIAA